MYACALACICAALWGVPMTGVPTVELDCCINAIPWSEAAEGEASNGAVASIGAGDMVTLCVPKAGVVGVATLC
ncbi:hypothetical protein BX661DRAFT_178032 [Kickxella alabastrina]|uniref:uncharacterized protein n=1 Tax=Kickxella alabastrina TaxID=61397 RepID=UPI00221E8744|nr:uncharacterized protein BX661DRAFT_178032 [Kickxella alabastrina]KAI7833264.1 hypothetical protein BX661DRAFT_178032 [Kickxella alabastrina]